MTGDDEKGTTPLGVLRADARGGLALRLDIEGATTVPLPSEGQLVIGRATDADVRVDHESVSRRHAVLRVGPRITLEDLGSQNGSTVRGIVLAPRTEVEVRIGDPIAIGGVDATIVSGGARAPSALREDMRAFERERIRAALEKCGGSQTKAAKLLGISRRTLVSRLAEHKLPRPRKS